MVDDIYFFSVLIFYDDDPLLNTSSILILDILSLLVRLYVPPQLSVEDHPRHPPHPALPHDNTIDMPPHNPHLHPLPPQSVHQLSNVLQCVQHWRHVYTSQVPLHHSVRRQP
jgi:hypothetical protein